jgi:hypothetical protein
MAVRILCFPARLEKLNGTGACQPGKEQIPGFTAGKIEAEKNPQYISYSPLNMTPAITLLRDCIIGERVVHRKHLPEIYKVLISGSRRFASRGGLPFSSPLFA